jgi:Leucine-rich repeat (LRR) protein
MNYYFRWQKKINTPNMSKSLKILKNEFYSIHHRLTSKHNKTNNNTTKISIPYMIQYISFYSNDFNIK